MNKARFNSDTHTLKFREAYGKDAHFPVLSLCYAQKY